MKCSDVRTKISSWSRNLSGTTVLSILALGLSCVNFYFQFLRDNSKTSFYVSHVEWHLEDGRFGRGPKLGIVGLVSNEGNRPSAIGKIMVTADAIQQGNDIGDCEKPKNAITVSWDKSINGGTIKDAMAFNVSGNSIVASYWNFESLPRLSKPAGENDAYKDLICLSVETMNYNGRLVRTKFALGTLSYGPSRITEFNRAQDAEQPIIVSE